MIPKYETRGEAKVLNNLVLRILNTYQISYLIPHRHLIQNTITKLKFYSMIYISNVYNRLGINGKKRKYNVFITSYRFYGTSVLQQAKYQALASFQNTMNNLFKHKLVIFLFVNINIIFIYSMTYEEHLVNNGIVLHKLPTFKVL